MCRVLQTIELQTQNQMRAKLGAICYLHLISKQKTAENFYQFLKASFFTI